jgi:hypothetical protein
VSPGAARRSVVELLVGAVLVTACTTVVALGVATWALTLLQAAYPCGETFLDHPSCRLRDAGAVTRGYLLVLAVPALCTVAAVAVGTVTFVRRRRAALPAALAFTVALVAFLTGRAVLLAAIADTVPW